MDRTSAFVVDRVKFAIMLFTSNAILWNSLSYFYLKTAVVTSVCLSSSESQ